MRRPSALRTKATTKASDEPPNEIDRLFSFRVSFSPWRALTMNGEQMTQNACYTT